MVQNSRQKANLYRVIQILMPEARINDFQNTIAMCLKPKLPLFQTNQLLRIYSLMPDSYQFQNSIKPNTPFPLRPRTKMYFLK